MTTKRGVAGLTGVVYGWTVPSTTGVSVIGAGAEDFAFSVSLPDLNECFWFSPELVEFVDHGPGTEIGIGKKRFIRRADGRWDEIPP
jgi:hypothetical protein